MAWGKAGSTTLSSGSDTITVSGMTASETNMILGHTLWSTYGGVRIVCDNDTGNNYAERRSVDGGSDGTVVNTSNIDFWADNTKYDCIHVGYFVNINAEEKLFIGFAGAQGAVGAGTAPNRREVVGKYTGSSQVTRIDFDNENSGLGDILTDSNLTVLGSEMTPASAVTFPTNVQIGSRAEITDTRKMYNLIEEKYEDDFSTDEGWVTQYASKMAYNATTKKLDPVKYENSNNGDNITIAKELDFTLGTKFVVRFVLDFSVFGNSPFMTMGVSDKDSTVNADTAQDYLGIVCHNGSTWSAQVKDNTELGTFTNVSQASWSGHQSNFGTDYYCELIRNEDSFTINIRTGSHTGTSVVTATTTISTIGTVSNLKYIKFGSYDATSAAGYCTTTIDDLSVYNGVTSPSSTPSKSWQEIGI